MICDEIESWCDFASYEVKEFNDEIIEVYGDDYDLQVYKNQYVKNYRKTDQLVYDTYSPHINPDYKIDHDYDPAYAINAFYDSFIINGVNTRVPYFSPYDPTYTEYEMDGMTSYDFHLKIVKNRCLKPIGETLPLKLKQLNVDSDETYLGFVDSIEDVLVGSVGFVFNPFAIESKNKILSVKATESAIEGTFQFRSKIYPFKWTYNHGRRIINSDVWRNNWGTRLNEFYCFSMVDRTTSVKRYMNATKSHFVVVPKVLFVKKLHGFDPGLDCSFVETAEYKVAVVPGTTYPLPSTKMSLLEVERKGFVQLEMHQSGGIHFTHSRGGARIGINSGILPSQRSIAITKNKNRDKDYKRSGGIQGIIKANMEQRGIYTDIDVGIKYIERQVVSDVDAPKASGIVRRENMGDPFVTHGKINNGRRGLFEKFVHVKSNLSFYLDYADGLRYANFIRSKNKWYMSIYNLNELVEINLSKYVEQVSVSYINYLGNAICDAVNVTDFFLMWMQLSPDEMLQKMFTDLKPVQCSVPVMTLRRRKGKVKNESGNERCDDLDNEVELLSQLSY